MSLLFMSPYVLSLCLYLCGRASGGLILIARQASKCLCRVSFLFAFASDHFSCYFAWQIIAIINHHLSLIWFCFCVSYSFYSCLLTYRVTFRLQDVRLRGKADRQCNGERLSPVCRGGPRAASCGHCQLYQQSHAWTSATQMRALKNLKTLDFNIFTCIRAGNSAVLGCLSVFIAESSFDGLLRIAKYCLYVSLLCKQRRRVQKAKD